MWPGGGWWRFGHHQTYEVVKTEMWAIIIYYWIFSPLLMVTAVPAFALPMWNNQHNVTTATGRNIRQLPCVSRRTGETGLCMFAYSCAKANGTHLGTCIDRFYFGSCCKVANYELEITESILNNYITSKDDLSSSTMKTPYNKNTVAFSFGTTNDGVRSTTITSSTPASPVSYSISSSTSSSPFVTFTTNAKSPSVKPETQSSISSSSSQFYGSSSVPSHIVNTSHSYTPSVSFISTTSSSPTLFQSASQNSISSSTSGYTRPSISSKPGKPGTKPKPLNTSSQKPSSKPKPTKNPIKLTSTSSVSISTQTSFPSSSLPPSKINFNTSSSGYFVSTTSNKPTYSTSYESSKPTKITYKPNISTFKPSTSSSSKKPSQSVKPTVGFSSSQSTTASYVQVPLSTVTQSTKPSTASSLLSNYTEIINSLLHTVSTGSSTISSSPSQIFNVSQNENLFTEYPSTSKTRPDYSSSSSISSQLWASSTVPQPPLITWTTINDVPVIPSDRTKPTGKPSMKPTSPYATSIGNKPSSGRPADATIGSPLHHQTTSKIQDTYINTTAAQTPSWVEISLTTHAPSVSQSSGTVGETSSTSSTEKLSVTSASTGTTNKIQSSSFTSTEESSSPTTSFSSSITNTFPDLSLNSTISPTTTSASLDTNEIENSSINMSNYKDVCGRRLFPAARIVGGEKATFGKWPWQISLRQWRTSTYLHKCGAALFNENWAVTAAHCVENVPPSDLLLRLGEHDLSSEDEPYGYQERRVQIVASHPQFDPRTFEYDLALLRFYEPVKFQPNIIPICVPTDDTNFVGSTAYVTGWGRLYEDGPLPSVLQEVTVPVIDNGQCENMYRTAGYVEHIPGIFICAGWKKGGFDSCEGDSGGPMVIQKPDKRWLLAGIISWGIGCAEPNQPGVYTRISEFRDWINQILQF